MSASNLIGRYLQKYSEPNPEFASICRWGPFKETVVVPSSGEDELLDGLFASLDQAAATQKAKTLVILVVNHQESTNAHYKAANEAVLKRLPAISQHGNFLTVAVLDRTADNPTPGVGFARKVGADLAAQLTDSGLVESAWIHTTDGDARVSPNYFDISLSNTHRWGLGPLSPAAVVHPFFHELEGERGDALSLYDTFLKYYCQGLEMAGSPFAFPTIGSTLSFTPEAYAQVRGFPKREAGEDFYFLHKIAKIGFVWEGGGQVRLVCRGSQRVPFGTGQSIEKISRLKEQGTEYKIYAPEVFFDLKLWLKAINQLSQGATWNDVTASLPTAVRRVLVEMGAEAEFATIETTRKGVANKLRHWHTWFDGFKTLRFIHLLRDHAYPNIPVQEAAERLSSAKPLLQCASTAIDEVAV